MSIIIMNFLIPVFSGIILLLSNRVQASETYDLESIRTTDGRLFRSIQILDADHHGLSFRHERGIAKVLYSSLSPNLRMLYEVVEELPEAAAEVVEPAVPAEEKANFPLPPLTTPVQLTALSRVRLPAPAFYLGGGYPFPDSQSWPGWWQRYDPVHRLTNPYFREVAVRDFLYSSGLLPVAPGIRVQRFYR